MSKILGIVSFITSLVGLFVFGYILGTVAIVTGIISIASAETEDNSGLSIAGLALGIIDVVLLFILQSVSQ